MIMTYFGVDDVVPWSRAHESPFGPAVTECLQAAREVRLRSGDASRELAWSLLQLAGAYLSHGMHREAARDAAADALSIFREHGPDTWECAVGHDMLSAIHHGTCDYQAAVDHLQMAIAIWEAQARQVEISARDQFYLKRRIEDLEMLRHLLRHQLEKGRPAPRGGNLVQPLPGSPG